MLADRYAEDIKLKEDCLRNEEINQIDFAKENLFNYLMQMTIFYK